MEASTSSSTTNHRPHLITAHSLGTGAGTTAAKMLVTWVQWLRRVYVTHPEIAKVWAQAINFVIANSHEGSLTLAKEIINLELLEDPPPFVVNHSFEQMAFSITKGKGSQTPEMGRDVAADYAGRMTKVASQSHIYIPIATSGAGCTGSNAIIPATKIGIEQGSLTKPFIILSAQSEMTKPQESDQGTTLGELYGLPVWAYVADNGYLKLLHDTWNSSMPVEQAYDRITYCLMHALRSELLQLIYRAQLDESKLEGQLFNGSGGLVSHAAADIDIHNPDVEEEVNRAIHLCLNNPFRVEQTKDESEQLAPIEVMVTSTLGGLPGTFEQKFHKAIGEQDILTKARKPVFRAHTRFSSYLPPEVASVSVFMTRKRPGSTKTVTLIYPPDNHPVVQQLRLAEVRAVARQNAPTMGRTGLNGSVSEKARSISPAPEPLKPLPQPAGESTIVEQLVTAASEPQELSPSEKAEATLTVVNLTQPVVTASVGSEPVVPVSGTEARFLLVSARDWWADSRLNLFRKRSAKNGTSKPNKQAAKNGKKSLRSYSSVDEFLKKQGYTLIPSLEIVASGESFLTIRDRDELFRLIDAVGKALMKNEAAPIVPDTVEDWFEMQLRQHEVSFTPNLKANGTLVPLDVGPTVLEQLLKLEHNGAGNKEVARELEERITVVTAFGTEMIRRLTRSKVASHQPVDLSSIPSAPNGSTEHHEAVH